jgi:hypothetical protein
MAKIKTIEELALQGEVDISQYGLKAEGLTILYDHMKQLRSDPKNKDPYLKDGLCIAELDLQLAKSDWQKAQAAANIERCRQQIVQHPHMMEANFEVDPAFVLPRTHAIGNLSEIRDAFRRLIMTPTIGMHRFGGQYNTFTQHSQLRIILARSSHEEEMPGEFETHFSICDKDDFETSFSNWLAAARKVRESGAGAVIAQALVSNGLTPHNLINNDKYVAEMLSRKEISDSITFGFDNFSFVGNTGSEYGADTMSISAVVGLPSKLVRGDDDFSLIQQLEGTTMITHSKHDYSSNFHRVGFSRSYPQKTLDIIQFESVAIPRTIQYRNLRKILKIDSEWGYFAFPFESMDPEHIFLKIMKPLKEKTGKHIEIEGTWIDDEFYPHIVQLRKYELPQNRLTELSDIAEDRLIQVPAVSYVADKFSGDLVCILSDDKVDEGLLRSKLHQSYIIATPNGCIPFKSFSAIDLDNFLDAQGILVPILNVARTCPGAHTYGFMMTVMNDIQKKVPVIALNYRPETLIRILRHKGLEKRIEEYQNFAVVRNITIESDGSRGQIYVN